ncbi:MAG: hypothetical protein JO167_05830, partial [Alphaproteobacteria bacterium]|nr:hypothetical protein [Alphaproteobacteria bacterium]
MAQTRLLFATSLYQAALSGAARLNTDLAKVCLAIAAEDRAGQRWAAAHGYRGYTSYASLNDLPQRAPEFAALKIQLDRHVAAFARAVDFDLGGRRLKLDS